MSALEFAARSSLVLAVALAASWSLRRQPAALRHWLLAAAIVLAAAQPLMNRVVPQLPILASTWTAESISPSPTTGVTTEFAFEPLVNVAEANRNSAWGAMAFRAWMAGAAISLVVLLTGLLWLTFLGSRAPEAGPAWHQVAEEMRAQLGIRQRVRIAITRHPAMLVTWGAIAPVILLPAGADGWPAERMRLVLAHELAHLARRDWLVQLLAETGRAVYWFNPLFWIACARLRRESEHACDDIVLDLGISGTSYASHLIDLARNFSVHGRTWLPAPSIARPSTLERRVRAMLNPQVDRRPVSRLRRAALAVILAGVAVPIAAATSMTAGAPSGVLRDPSGRVLPGATVRLTAIGTDAVHETQSDSTGTFRFGEIPDGDYMLSARLPGFLGARTRVRVNASTPPLEITVQVGTLKETVSVKAGDVSAPFVPRYVPAKPACGTTEVGGNLKPPSKLKHVTPRYKSEWINAGVTGNVLLQAVIGRDGKVRDIEVVAPGDRADLEEEAVSAVSQWEFSPTWLNCEPIDVRIFVTVNFSPGQ
jgi:TonB family protein